MVFWNLAIKDTDKYIKELSSKFKGLAKMLYPLENQNAQCIIAKSPTGKVRQFPLLQVNAALFELPAKREEYSFEEISNELAKIKKKSKSNPESCSYAKLSPR